MRLATNYREASERTAFQQTAIENLDVTCIRHAKHTPQCVALTAPHPEWSPWDPKSKTGFGWPQQVGSVCYETPEQLVLIDPLVPPSRTPACRQFWQALDDAVQQKRQPVTVLLSTDWHDRSAKDIFNRERCS